MNASTEITRRALLHAAPVVALISAVPALARSHGPNMSDHIQRHLKASADMEATNAVYEAARTAANLPSRQVVLSRHYLTKEPHYTCSEPEIRAWARQGAVGLNNSAAWADRKVAELHAARVCYDAAFAAAGLTALLKAANDAEELEAKAWSALITAPAADRSQNAQRASYLLSILEKDVEPRLSFWLEEFLGGMIPGIEGASK